MRLPDTSDASEVVAIVLAAGSSAHMGGADKLRPTSARVARSTLGVAPAVGG